MFDLRKLFARHGGTGRRIDPDPDSDYHPSDRQGEGLETEYQSLIAAQFRRWGISTACVTIEVRKLGQAPDGSDVFVGMVRLAHWERESALRLLLGLPLLEAKVRKTLRGTWLADYSHFAGLWLHASEQMEVPPELRELLARLVPATARAPGAAGVPSTLSGYGSSSLPPSSGATPSRSSEAGELPL